MTKIIALSALLSLCKGWCQPPPPPPPRPHCGAVQEACCHETPEAPGTCDTGLVCERVNKQEACI